MADSSKKLIVFEPNKDNYGILKGNISLNNLEEKVLSFDKACGNVPGVLSLGGHALNSLFAENSTQANSNYQVEIVVLDDFLKENGIDTGEISFIKIDVEGFEYQVLKGLEKTLSDSDEIVVYLETHAKCNADDTIDPKKDSESFLKSLGYTEKKRFDCDSCFWEKIA